MDEINTLLAQFNPETAASEMDTWGGWYRRRYRENPDKATRVLADIRVTTREGRIRTSPGRAFHDLWKRLP